MNNQRKPQLPERIWLSRFWSNYTEHNCQFSCEQKQQDDISYVRADLLQQPASGERCGECGTELVIGIRSVVQPDHCMQCWFEKIEGQPAMRVAATGAGGSEQRQARYDVKANVDWLKANAKDYAGQWVAIRNGVFLDADRSYTTLRERVGATKGTGILVTWACDPPAPVAEGEPQCACPQDTYTVGMWTARYRLPECPVHGDGAPAPAPAAEAPQGDGTPRHYPCSCGGALTEEEYIEHLVEKGHDRGVGVCPHCGRGDVSSSVTSGEVASSIAHEIVERWFKEDLPERARVFSSVPQRLRILVVDVLSKHLDAGEVEREVVQANRLWRIWLWNEFQVDVRLSDDEARDKLCAKLQRLNKTQLQPQSPPPPPHKPRCATFEGLACSCGGGSTKGEG